MNEEQKTVECEYCEYWYPSTICDECPGLNGEKCQVIEDHFKVNEENGGE